MKTGRSMTGKRRTGRRGEKGYALLMAVILIFFIGSLVLNSMAEVVVTMRMVRQRHLYNQCASFSRATLPDLRAAAQEYVTKLFAAYQVVLNERARAFPTVPTADLADQFFKTRLPKHFLMELRGGTLAPANPADDEGDWTSVKGSAVVYLYYDGLRPATDLGLGADPTRLPYVLQLTCLVPYDIEIQAAPVAANGDGTMVLGSAWRPTGHYLEETGSGPRIQPPSRSLPTPPSGGLVVPEYQRARYSSAIQMHVYAAFAVPRNEPPLPPGADLFDPTPPCNAIPVFNGCVEQDDDGNCVTSVVQDGCGGIYSGQFRPASAANEIIDAINAGGGRGPVNDALAKVQEQYTPIPVGLRDRIQRQPPYDYGFYPPAPPGVFNPVDPSNRRIPQNPGGGGYGNVPLTSNIYNIRIMFTETVSLLPGRYLF